MKVCRFASSQTLIVILVEYFGHGRRASPRVQHKGDYTKYVWRLQNILGGYIKIICLARGADASFFLLHQPSRIWRG